MKEIFENLRENVSEACFEDIVSMVEELLNETKKANKVAHQEAIFKKLNPKGVKINVFSDDKLSPKGEAAKKRLTGGIQLPNDDLIDAHIHSIQDYRELENTDSKNNADYWDDWREKVLRHPKAQGVRTALGRDDKFSRY